MTAEDARGATIAELIDRARFRPTRLSNGYDMGEVDDFLDRVGRACTTGGDVSALLDTAHFTLVRFRSGYAVDDVDDFLGSLRGAAPAS
ncbi:DivIVA domain-containing protein [Nocardioides alcanivorans]|uniref:DivIVA domain-containing protein n=1 Tax=Nocardioides alcanivorans TaxID=2897352 RepID=UPI001F1C3B0C|nr:DivIVA domain-containing protein [Nocardioides alcanivorans]